MTETTTRDYNKEIAGRSAVADMVKSTIMNVPLLPLERHHKQALLEIQEPIERLRRLETLLDELEQR
ncbi:MAG TPA: hypothetical protein DHU56_09655 [Marinobacter sp.]|jgi:Lon protease-like protein|nr:hypothetical protein [Marinobacter sp.]